MSLPVQAFDCSKFNGLQNHTPSPRHAGFRFPLKELRRKTRQDFDRLAYLSRKPCRSGFRSHHPPSQPPPKNLRTSTEGPFGEVIRATGPMAKTNPFRFSTKYQDDETDLLYYGYRYYNVNTGRWLSRDPVGEKGGNNLYCFVLNQPTSEFDRLGLEVVGHAYKNMGSEDFLILGHTAVEIYGHAYGFGPKDPHVSPTQLLNTPGSTSDWETTVPPRLTFALHVRKIGSFRDDKGGKCCNATPERIIQCANYFKATWNNTPYKALTRNCGHYVETIVGSCCLWMFYF